MRLITLTHLLVTLTRRLITPIRRQSTVIRLITHHITHMDPDTTLAFSGVMAETGIMAATAIMVGIEAATVITADMGATTAVGAAIDKSPQCLKIESSLLAAFFYTYPSFLARHTIYGIRHTNY